jgi:pyruvate/2-oxoglutarate/acetoin dehydrogenase E1 component
MLATALQCPDPALIFETALLHNLSGPLAANAGAVDIDRAHMMRPGKDVTLLSYGGSRGKTLAAAQALATDGIDAEVIDLRSLRPLDDATIMALVARTRRAMVVDKGWRSRSIAAEIAARIMEQCF